MVLVKRYQKTVHVEVKPLVAFFSKHKRG